jgi:Vacuolar membrane-associated protein Iml1
VIENVTTTDWDSLIVRIKREFVRYPFDVGWNLSNEHGRRPSTAAQGNILEAVNVTLNLMQFHYLDRDLHRVGNSIVIVSPGCGVFEVDRDLAGITYQRMMDNGIGSDMLSLGLPPLHTAPFFHYNNDLFAVEAHGVDAEKKYHEVPHWMHLSFFSYDNESQSQDFAPPNENKGKTSSMARCVVVVVALTVQSSFNLCPM